MTTASPGKLSDDDIALARASIREAFAYAGYLSGDKYVCPACQRVHKKKDTLSIRVHRGKGTWKCFSSGEGGDALQLMQDAFGYNFPQSVNALLGREVGPQQEAPKPIKRELPPLPEERKPSEIDPEVYAAVLDHSGEAGRFAAVEYYGKWHISADAVMESRASQVLDPKQMEKDLIERFGLERLYACGLVTKTSAGKDYFLVNRDYPVIEPHITPAGRVVGMQFRAAGKQLAKVNAHARYAAARDAGDTSVKEVPYAPKFMSLAGIDASESLVGFGLPRLWDLPAGSLVRLVEGYKDYVAARTLGHEAFGIAGTSASMGERVLALLRKHRIYVALDGDEAGVAAQAKWVSFFAENKVPARPLPTPPGMDITDILVDRHADMGCPCDVCEQWRAAHSNAAA